MALASLPAAALTEMPLFAALAQARPNSRFAGVQIGVITYSYRSMPDQSAEATLKYVLGSGISAIELMDGPVENFLGRPAPAARGGGGFPGGGPGGRRGGGAGQAPAGPTPYEQLLAGTMPSCAPNEGRAGVPGALIPGGRGGNGPTPEAIAAADELRKWRTSVSMDKVKAVRKMYNDAGVTIYAYKSDGLQKNMQTTDAELDYLFNVAAALGATHTTMELPAPGPEGTAMLKRMAQFAEKHKIYIAYHTHAQGSMSAFDEALAMSKWNMSNVDLGHYTAAGNNGGTPIQFLERHHDRIASFHLKDRTLPAHCSLTTPFGLGDGMIKDILLLMKKNKWTFPATIELEWPVPADSDAVKEVKKAVDYARGVLLA
jgi:sugar phosphate isomerase/epimerase